MIPAGTGSFRFNVHKRRSALRVIVRANWRCAETGVPPGRIKYPLSSIWADRSSIWDSQKRPNHRGADSDSDHGSPMVSPHETSRSSSHAVSYPATPAIHDWEAATYGQCRSRRSTHPTSHSPRYGCHPYRHAHRHVCRFSFISSTGIYSHRILILGLMKKTTVFR